MEIEKLYSKILTIENKKNEKFLRKKTSVFDFSKYSKKYIENIILHMRKIMVSTNGIGLSANQIGLDSSIFVAQLPSNDKRGYKGKFYAIFNPKIIYKSPKEFDDIEGCLSIPYIYGIVSRSKKIIIEGFDKNANKISIKAEGLLSRIFQHEFDHLNGILFVDKAKNIRDVRNF